MAYSKIILNGETLMDVTSDTVVAGSMTSGTTATKKDGTKITGTIVTKSAADLTASGSTVTVPGGYYSAQATKNVASTTHPNPTAAITSSTGVVTATHTQSAGYVAAGTTTGTTQLTSKAAATYNTSTADQTIASYRWLTGTQTIKSVTTSNLTAANIASGVVVKVGDANNASRITQVTGTYAPAVSSATVTPTETAQTLNATGVYGYKPVTINAISSTYVGTGVAKKSSADTTFASATGTFTAPIGYYSAAATKTLTTQAAQTIYPSTADQTVASYRWLTGTQTFKSVTTTNLTAANIASGVVVKVGDSGNASRIAQITGTYAGAGGTHKMELLNSGLYDERTPRYFTIKHNNITYYTEGDIINFKEGDTLSATIYMGYGNSSVYLNGSFIGSGINVSFSAPSYPLSLSFDHEVGAMYFNEAFPSPLAYSYMVSCTNLSNNSIYFIYNSQIYSSQNTSLTLTPRESVTIVNNKTISLIVRLNATDVATLSPSSSSTFILGPLITQIAGGTNYVSIQISNPYYYHQWNVYEGALLGYYYGSMSIPTKYTWLGTGTFARTIYLQSVYGPNILYTNMDTFSYCTSLTSVSFPKVKYMGANQFYMCSKLTSIFLPELSGMGDHFCYSCSKLASVSLPKCTEIGSYAFCSCTSLSSFSAPLVSYIGSSAFQCCYSLSTLSFPNCNEIGKSAFTDCYKLVSLYLMGSYAPILYNSQVFASTPIGGYSTSAGQYGSIYVPESLYTEYQNATGWAYFANVGRIVSV